MSMTTRPRGKEAKAIFDDFEALGGPLFDKEDGRSEQRYNRIMGRLWRRRRNNAVLFEQCLSSVGEPVQTAIRWMLSPSEGN